MDAPPAGDMENLSTFFIAVKVVKILFLFLKEMDIRFMRKKKGLIVYRFEVFLFNFNYFLSLL